MKSTWSTGAGVTWCRLLQLIHAAHEPGMSDAYTPSAAVRMDPGAFRRRTFGHSADDPREPLPDVSGELGVGIDRDGIAR